MSEKAKRYGEMPLGFTSPAELQIVVESYIQRLVASSSTTIDDELQLSPESRATLEEIQQRNQAEITALTLRTADISAFYDALSQLHQRLVKMEAEGKTQRQIAESILDHKDADFVKFLDDIEGFLDSGLGGWANTFLASMMAVSFSRVLGVVLDTKK